MSKKRNAQRKNNKEKTFDDIPEGFLQGEPINHPKYGHGFITNISSDGKKLRATLGFDKCTRIVILPR